MKSFPSLANINTLKQIQPKSVKLDVSLHTSVSRGHSQVNCTAVLLFCKLASAEFMKKMRIPTCMPIVAKAINQPNTLSVTMYEYTESLPILLKAYMSFSLILVSISDVREFPISLRLAVMYRRKATMQHNAMKQAKRITPNSL